MKILKNNIFSDIPDNLPDEFFEIIASNNAVRIERIVSRGHTSPDWYDQDKNEFVFVVSGAAKLFFELNSETVHMKAGDYLIIPAHVRHKVVWTQPESETVWLAVYY